MRVPQGLPFDGTELDCFLKVRTRRRRKTRSKDHGKGPKPWSCSGLSSGSLRSLPILKLYNEGSTLALKPYVYVWLHCLMPFTDWRHFLCSVVQALGNVVVEEETWNSMQTWKIDFYYSCLTWYIWRVSIELKGFRRGSQTSVILQFQFKQFFQYHVRNDFKNRTTPLNHPPPCYCRALDSCPTYAVLYHEIINI